MKTIIICFLFVVLLLSCEKKGNNGITIESQVSTQVNESNVHIKQEFVDNNRVNFNEKAIEYPVNIIRDYIINDFGLGWSFSNLEECLKELNIVGDYRIEEKYFEIPHYPKDHICIYTIEFGCYTITARYSTAHPSVLFVLSLKVELNEDNYLNLFPYRHLDDFKADNEFGQLDYYDRGENEISYIKKDDLNDIIGYCDLIFENGILKYVKILPYIP